MSSTLPNQISVPPHSGRNTATVVGTPVCVCVCMCNKSNIYSILKRLNLDQVQRHHKLSAETVFGIMEMVNDLAQIKMDRFSSVALEPDVREFWHRANSPADLF